MKRITVPERGAETLFGTRDENLRFLEDNLKVRIKSAGGELLVEGEEQGEETVAQIFPRQPLFDVVIFDEASQIRILDGLLSMSFGKQVIIVGDKNQLPPTDFFAGFVNPEADSEVQDFGISESLLDEFGRVTASQQNQARAVELGARLSF